MGWMLVVSGDESFQREAIAYYGGRMPVVGATGDASARSLVRAIDVETILVDALDDVGRRFLAILRSLPMRTLPRVVAIDPSGTTPLVSTSPSLSATEAA